MTDSPTHSVATKKWKGGVIAILIVLVAALGWTALRRSSQDSVNENEKPVFEVKRGPLTISVTEAGTIQAREQVVLESEVEGQTTIIFLVPEGARVKAGDLLIELDSSSLVDEKVDQEIRVQNAEAAFIRARENLAVVQNQAKSDIDKAVLQYDFAKQDLDKYIEGEFPKSLKEAQSKISLASEELQRAEEKLKWSRVLFEEQYLSQSELQADELAANKAKLDLELAMTTLDLLRDYTNKRDLAALKSDVKQAEMALERTRRKANADVVQAEADLRAKESEFKRQQDKLEKIEEQISKTRIIAPQDGMVVYATSARASWRGNTEPLEEGQQVRERQELIYLPTADSFKAEVKVHESSLDKIRLGLPVRITIDALPGRTFTGKVSRIAPLPDAQSIFMNPDLKVYNTEIDLDGETAEIRTGMSCQAEIIVTRYPDALYVPIQAVLRVNKTHSVYVVKNGKEELRPVKIGFDNNRMVMIASGLEEGEKVLLTPPLASATLDRDEDFGDDMEIPAPDQVPQRPERRSPDMVGGPGPEGGVGGPPPPGGGRPDFGSMSQEQREAMRQRFQNMTPEEREAMRQRFMQGGGRTPSGEGRGSQEGGEMRRRSEELTPEQRESMRQRMMQRRSNQQNQESSTE